MVHSLLYCFSWLYVDTLLTVISILHIVVAYCGDLPVISNGVSSSTDATSWPAGSVVTYSCDMGFKLKDNSQSTIECVAVSEETAEWSGSTNIICSAGM